MKEAAAKTLPKPAVLSLAQLLTEQPALWNAEAEVFIGVEHLPNPLLAFGPKALAAGIIDQRRRPQPGLDE